MSTALLVMWMWAQTLTDGHGNLHEDKQFHPPVPLEMFHNPDPMDVPAVQEIAAPDLCWAVPGEDNVRICGGPHVRWTCAEKSRILLTAEDGTKHCIKFGVR